MKEFLLKKKIDFVVKFFQIFKKKYSEKNKTKVYTIILMQYFLYLTIPACKHTLLRNIMKINIYFYLKIFFAQNL